MKYSIFDDAGDAMLLRFRPLPAAVESHRAGTRPGGGINHVFRSPPD
jgi:hypothetical protein